MKPVVHYKPNPEIDFIAVGRSARVFPVDHQNHVPGQSVSNTKYAITSTVQSYDPVTGEFETLNTRYVPQKAA